MISDNLFSLEKVLFSSEIEVNLIILLLQGKLFPDSNCADVQSVKLAIFL